jgi:hypothetical protein
MENPTNLPLLEQFETMPAARPLFRILAAIAASFSFIVAAQFGLDRELTDAVAVAIAGFVLATVAATGYPPFRSKRIKRP